MIHAPVLKLVAAGTPVLATDDSYAVATQILQSMENHFQVGLAQENAEQTA
jgi:hypothetical protein